MKEIQVLRSIPKNYSFCISIQLEFSQFILFDKTGTECIPKTGD